MPRTWAGSKKDANQDAIADALIARGATVQSLAAVGCGCPDLLVGLFGINLVLEIKDGSKCPSERALTEAEAKWHRRWHGQKAVVENVDQALKACGL